MKQFFDRTKIYSLLMGASLIFGAIYLLTAHMNFVMNMIEYRAFTLTNMVYAFFRLDCLVFPMLFLMKRNAFLPKILLEKFFLGAFAIAALSGVMWIFNYLNYYTFRELLNAEMMYLYQALTSNYIAANRLLWGTTGFAGVVCSFVLSLFYFITALLMHRNRKIVATCFSVIFLFRLIAAMVTIAVGDEVGIYGEWFGNNTFWLLSALCMTAGIWYAARSDECWVKKIWGESVQQEFDED